MSYARAVGAFDKVDAADYRSALADRLGDLAGRGWRIIIKIDRQRSRR